MRAPQLRGHPVGQGEQPHLVFASADQAGRWRDDGECAVLHEATCPGFEASMVRPDQSINPARTMRVIAPIASFLS